MQSRGKMNSKFLQEKFEYLYGTFYSDHQLVTCVNNCFEWTPSFGFTNFKLIINHKVPTKTYCWIKKSKEWIIIINSIYNYNCNSDKRETFSWTSFIPNYLLLLDYIKSYLNKKWIKEWITIDYISENPKWHWFWFICASSTCLATALLSLSWDIKRNETLSTNNNLKNEVFKMAWEISKICCWWKSDWSWCFNTINDYCMTVWTIAKSLSLDNNEISSIAGIEKIDKSLLEYLWFDFKWSWLPIDFGIIYSWNDNKSEKTDYLIDNFKSKLNVVKEKIKYLNVQNWFKDKDLDINKHLWKNFDNIIDDYLTILSYKTALAFQLLFENPYDDIYCWNFINIINENWRFCELIEKENHLSKLFKSEFEKQKIFDDEIVWCERIDLGKIGWSFIFVTKYNKSRETINKILETLKQKWYNNVFLEYCSWEDWHEYNWVQILQNVYDGSYSDYIDKDYVVSKDMLWWVNMWRYSDILNENKDKLILDWINKKIYFQWEKVTSKQIHSQSSTVEILWVLIENLDKEVFNHKLECSSYSKNKNEMMWKIILPLTRFVQDNLWLKLPLVCKWWINDFYIKLNCCDKKIIYVDKIN